MRHLCASVLASLLLQADPAIAAERLASLPWVSHPLDFGLSARDLRPTFGPAPRWSLESSLQPPASTGPAGKRGIAVPVWLVLREPRVGLPVGSLAWAAKD